MVYSVIIGGCPRFLVVMEDPKFPLTWLGINGVGALSPYSSFPQRREILFVSYEVTTNPCGPGEKT